MDYPLILKYEYTYIISGNYNKPATYVFYQLFSNEGNWKMITRLDSVSEKNKVDIIEMKDDEVTFSYNYIRYTAPNTFASDSEVIEEVRTIKKGEEVSINCVETYWAYARGGENGPALMKIKWISREELMQGLAETAKEDSRWAEKTARFLIDEGQYAEAFALNSAVESNTLTLGLCYEKGYGVEMDLDKALEIYLSVRGYDAERGIERVFKARGKTIKFDDVKKTILHYNLGHYRSAFANAVIPTEIGDNTLEDLRKNVELAVLLFLEIGRPSNDPFQHPSDDMSRLAAYYDAINNRPLEERPKYHTVEYEDDPYDGGSFRYDIYHDDLIVETLKKEAEKNDVIALGCLLVQFGHGNSDSDFCGAIKTGHEELVEKLIAVANEGSEYEQGMACYFLGLYYETLAKKAENNYGYDSDVKDKTYTYTGKDIEKDLDDYLARKNKGVKEPLRKEVWSLRNEHRYLVSRKPEEKEEIRQLENFIIYLFNQNRAKYTKLHDESIEKAINYFQISMDKGFHLAVPHLAKKIIEEKSVQEALEILEAHEKYIPYFNSRSYCAAAKFHDLLKELREKIG